MQARLKVLHDKANVKQVKLLPVTLIGRSTECNLKIASSQVSRNHCRITLGVDSVFVEDLGSANGTLIDGQPLPAHQPTAIAPGAHLIVGPAEFQIDYVASTSATLVLPRTGVPQPELPSTEMIFPAQLPAAAPVATAPVATAPVAVQSAAPSATDTVANAPPPVLAPPTAAVQVAAPMVPVAVAVPVAAAVVAAPVVAVAQVAAAEVQVSPPVPQAAPTGDDTQFLSNGLDFGMPAAVEGSDEVTQFMFQEGIPDSVPTSSAAPPQKKAGLKSLFSMFGRKGKPAAATPEPTEAAAAAAPSVFLPTVEAQAPVESVAEEAPAVQEEAPVIATGTEFAADDSSQTVESDDGFQQFLSQF